MVGAAVRGAAMVVLQVMGTLLQERVAWSERVARRPAAGVRLQLEHACHQAVGAAYDGAQLPFA